VVSTPESDFDFRGIERWVLDLLAVPAAPEPPDGSRASIQVFHAGRQFYLWSILIWAIRTVLVFGAFAVASIAIGVNLSRMQGWVQTVLMSLLVLAWLVFVSVAFITFVARRLDYRLRWYIVTDRSLRIRSGVFNVRELTMTYGNIQEIRVTAGPLQHLLDLADLEVQAAGGGGGEKQSRNTHTGRFDGLSNANAIRDLIVERLRHYRDSGLGETIHAATPEPDSLGAAQKMLEEVRALRAALNSWP